ncbi:MAG TPA: ABC transporter substrate-binding protein [Gaiellaceae bacterium]|nr:ABC transporter substrate-binding protein [Gaiellaceae bacterium]
MRGLSVSVVVAAALILGTTAARPATGRVLVVGAEQGAAGFNTRAACCGDQWSSWLGAEEALRGAFVQTPNGRWVPQLVSSATANAKGVTYTIKPNAVWYWGGRKVPVTYKDFVYTLQRIDDPNNEIADRSGYANLDPKRFTHAGANRVTFFWRTKECTDVFPCGPYGNWQSIFSSLYPSFALHGSAFDSIWANCICGSDGKPVSDGPYYLASYTAGVGSVLRANPYWSVGRKPAIKEIDFKILGSTAAEVQAIENGTVNMIVPTFSQALEALKNQKGMSFTEAPGYEAEYLDFRVGTGSSNVLLRAPFVREAISMAIDRTAIIAAVFGDLIGPLTPLDSALFFSGQAGYRKDFGRWNYNPAKAVATLAKHCTGGPAAPDPANTAVWTCSGLPAVFNWSWPSGDTARTLIEDVAKEELSAIGIRINDASRSPDDFYGPGGIASGAFDLAEYPDGTSGDPGEWAGRYSCGGADNATGFCSRKVDALLTAAARAIAPSTRTRDFAKADAQLAKGLPVLPLYESPVVLVHASALLGLTDDPAPGGPFWNVEDWHWH